MSKNVAVFVDVANIFYAAKAAGADIDYVTLLKAAVGSRDFVRAYAYTGLDPENENQRNFHSFLARHGYKVVSKDIRKYGDGKVKANLDIELVVDMMKTARNLDVAVVVSGDGDFAPAIRAVQEMGVRVEVISFRGNTSSDLIEVADAFYDITQLAKVERDSTRSGRRVAGDEEDLSMTEVPEKQTEGRGGRRRRGGRGDGRDEREGREVAAARSGGGRQTRGGGRLTVLPGEKLSHVAGADDVAAAVPEAAVPEASAPGVAGEDLGEELDEAQADAGLAEGEHHRRRRGGRGRGRRGQGAGETEPGQVADESPDADQQPAAAATRPNQFGSVWDSQIGMAGRPARLAPLTPDEDDFAEPEIPEYLLAERRRSGGGGGGGGRGRGGRGGGARSAYAAAMDRERFGRSGGSGFSAPVRQPAPQQQRRRDERPRQPQPQPQPQRGGQQRRGSSEEPWSEVPPEVEELLRQSLAARMSAPQAAPAPAEGKASASSASASAQAGAGEAAEAPKKRAPSRRKKAAEGEASSEGAEQAPVEAAAEAPKKRAPSRRKKAAEAPVEATQE